ncbi:hypothetical protein MMPV_006517 [Pyropia vietnamensis]
MAFLIAPALGGVAPSRRVVDGGRRSRLGRPAPLAVTPALRRRAGRASVGAGVPPRASAEEDTPPSPSSSPPPSPPSADSVFATLRSRLRRTSIYLIGMTGAGKTTVARSLAASLGYRPVDVDELIEAVAGESIPAIFAADGEEGFRALESEVLGSVAAFVKCVVATGGGVVVRRENWGALHAGVVVWLDVPVAELAGRVGEDPGRPLVAAAADKPGGVEGVLTDMLAARGDSYAQADVRVQAGGDQTPEAVARAVAEALLTFIANNPPRFGGKDAVAPTAAKGG